MHTDKWISVAMLIVLLALALASDVRRQRIPNHLVLVGLLLGMSGQAFSGGIGGLGDGVLAVMIGFGIFIPLYATGGMAAGDVKLMAMVGSFLTPNLALFAALFSLVAGGLWGVLLVVMHGQLRQTLARYWLMLISWTYIAPAEGEVAGRTFPFAAAITLGTLASLFWLPFIQWLGR